MLRHYAALPDPIEESDISSTTSLQPVSHYYVLYLAYSIAGQMDEAKMYFDRYKELLGEIKPPLNSGGTPTGWGNQIKMYRG
jgi:hypothetical protein